MIFEQIRGLFSVSSFQVGAKIITSLLILAVALFILKLVSKFWDRWQKNLVKRLKSRRDSDIASVDTKLMISRKIIYFTIYFLAFVLILMQFESVRNIGTGLLASAGLAGIIIGMAAQNTVSNVLAGLSISFSQPIRLNDAVIYENEFGWIEDIMLMYTMIRTWDNRRIMVPNSVLVNKVVQNWSIKDPTLLGAVMLYADYTCDVSQIRDWVREIVETSENSTDEKVNVVQVVDFTEKTMVLRILAKGPDAPTTWALRCEIREKLIQKHQEAGIVLPKVRVEGPPPVPDQTISK